MAEINITKAKTWWIGPVLIGLVMILSGILMIIYKRDALVTIITVAGILLIISGIVMFVTDYRSNGHIPVSSIVMIVFGIVLALVPSLVSDALMALIAVGLCIFGIYEIVGSLWAERKPTDKVILSVIVGAISLALGVYALLNLNSMADVVMIVIGAVLAVNGCILLIKGVRVYRDYH